MKLCTKCLVEKPLTSYYFKKGRGTYYTQCKVCHGSGKEPTSFANSWYRERFSDEELTLFSKLKNLWTKAKLRPKGFDPAINWKYLFDIWEQQNGRCVYSGVPLSIEANHPHSVSIDRIDSSIGYLKGNLQLVSAAVSRMKQEFDEEFFLSTCRLIAENMPTTQDQQAPKGNPVDWPE